jgi:peptide/nickel transport system substrate-binding protein
VTQPPRARPTLVAALALAFALAACPARAPRGARVTPEVPVRGGTLRVLLVADAGALDPQRAGRPAAWFFARALHRGLLAFPDTPGDAGEQPVPDLAAAMPDVSADGRTYTFRLRTGIAFGAPLARALTSADVAWSLRRARTAAPGLAPYLAAIAAVETPDARTVILRLRAPSPVLPWILAQPRLAVVPDHTPARADAQRIAPSGPYRIEKYTPERTLTLVRNPAWSADTVRGAYVDRIEATMRVPLARAQRTIASGAADLLLDPGPPDQLPPAQAAPPAATAPAQGARIVGTSSGCVRYLTVDARTPPFNNRRVRLALAAAIPRARLGPISARRFLPPTVIGHDERPVIPEDLARARADLARAGFARGFPVSLLAANAPRDRVEVAQLRTALARVRLRVVARLVPPSELPAALATPRSATLALRSWCADWPGLSGSGVLAAVARRDHLPARLPPRHHRGPRRGRARVERRRRRARRNRARRPAPMAARSRVRIVRPARHRRRPRLAARRPHQLLARALTAGWYHPHRSPNRTTAVERTRA